MTAFTSVKNLWRLIDENPLTKHKKLQALGRIIRWQLAQRLFPARYIVPFANDLRLVADRGMVSATGNIYCGLMEYEDMGFVMHVLRSEDVFCDIGANVGIFTVIAAGVSEAKVIAIEPVPSTAAVLLENVRLNQLQDLVRIEQVVIGEQAGSISFTTDGGTSNRIAHEQESGATAILPMKTIEMVLDGQIPYLIKIDVEGFEWPILKAAEATLSNPACNILIVETNGSGARYDIPDNKVHDYLLGIGFKPYTYDPKRRKLIALPRFHNRNTIYIKDGSDVSGRISSSQKFMVSGEAF